VSPAPSSSFFEPHIPHSDQSIRRGGNELRSFPISVFGEHVAMIELH
jgi:hypothetical protein